jgi:O-antigen/teichoic acid export membrane protein
MLTKALRYLGFLYFPAAFGLASISRTVMTVLYQARLASEGNAPLMVLAVFSILNAFATILNSGLKSIGRTKAFIYISLSALVFDAIIVTVSSPVLGLYGAVIARATSIVVLFLLTLFVLRKELPIIIDREGLVKGLAAGLLVVPPTLFIEYGLSFSSIFVKLGVEVIAAIACYFFAMLLFKALRKEDLNILRKIFPSRMGGIINMFGRFCAG